MAIMPGTNADDTLSGTDGDDYFTPFRGDDTVDAGPGRDRIEIEPWSGNDTILDFTSGEDTLLVNYFPTVDSVEDLTPFLTYRDNTGSTILDLSAAAGEKPGTQIVTFSQTASVQPTDIGVNTGEFYDPDYVPAGPEIPPANAPDPNAFRGDGIVIGTDGNDYVTYDFGEIGTIDVIGGGSFQLIPDDPIGDGDDLIYTKGGSDAIATGAGRDIILIKPVSNSISLIDFDPNYDTLVFNDFPNFDSFDDVKFPFINSWNTKGRDITVLNPGSTPDPPIESGTPTVWMPDGIGRDDLTPDNIKFNVALDLGLPTVRQFDPEGRLPPRPSLELTDDPEELVQQQMALTGSNDEVEFVGRPVDDWQIDF